MLKESIISYIISLKGILYSIFEQGNRKGNVKICKKICLQVVGDKEERKRVYSYISDGQYAQYRGLNILMGTLASKYYECGKNLKDPLFREFQKDIFKKESLDNLLNGIGFAVGADTRSSITQTVRNDFMTSVKNGLARGERTITNYKRTYPLIIRGRDIHFFHEYGSEDEFIQHLKQNHCDIYLKTVNHILFRVELGSMRNEGDRILRETLKFAMDGTYKVCGSKITINEKGKIILILTLDKPKTELFLDHKKVMAVKLGDSVTANASITKKRQKVFGNAMEMQRMKTMISERRSRLNSSMKYSRSGHGRAKKMNCFNRLQRRESGFAKNYNHKISKDIISYAIKNKCGTILLEDFEAYDKEIPKDEYAEKEANVFPYMNWTYYQLQQMIEYKAAMNSIQVVKIPVILKDYEGMTDMEIAAAMLLVEDGINSKAKKKAVKRGEA